jgi:hypothetical protein
LNFVLFSPGIIAGIPIPFNLSVSDACKLNCQCPIKASDVNVAQITVPILKEYPSISLYVRIEIEADDQKKDYTCLQFAATITSGFTSPKLIDRQHGKNLEMLNEKK